MFLSAHNTLEIDSPLRVFRNLEEWIVIAGTVVYIVAVRYVVDLVFDD